MRAQRRTILMLASCQALAMTGGSIVGLTGAIVGSMLAPDRALSTLPIAVQQAGVMAATIPAARLAAASDPELSAQLAAGGDDYELLFTAPPDAEEAIGRLSAELGLPITAIGTIDGGSGVRLLDANGHAVQLAAAGYRHF